MRMPSTSTYDTNGPVRTNRQGMFGDYCSASLRMKSTARKLCAGFAWFSGVRTFTVYPVYTWCEYPTGIVDIPLSGGLPTNAADAAIYASAGAGDPNTPWRSAWTYPYPGPTLHGIELRYFCELYSSNTRKIVWMSSGGGATDTDYPDPAPPQAHRYVPNPSIDITTAFTLKVDVDGVERVAISQDVAGGGWTWVEDTFKDGMGKTRAVFDVRANNVNSSLTIGGQSIAPENMPASYIPSYPFDSTRNIEGKAGVWTTTLSTFGWGVMTVDGGDAYLMDGSAVFSNLTEVSSMTVGVTDMDLRLRAGQLYQGDDTNCRGTAQDNTFKYYAKNAPASANGATVYTHAKWTDIGLTYQHTIDFEMDDGTGMDNGETPIDPQFLDIASNTAWTGTTSPIITYDGVWELKMYNLSGSIMSTYNTTVDHVVGAGAYWSRSNPAPTELRVKFTNPQDYNDMVRSVYDDIVDDYNTCDDYRCQFIYPRQYSMVSISLSDITLDGLDTLGTLGVGGWTGVNCTLAVVGGNLRVTNATAGAYIYRKDWVFDSDIRKPKHMPPHRFIRMYANCVDGSSSVIPFALGLSIKRTEGADTMTKVYSAPITEHPTGTPPAGLTADSWIARYDTCHPDNYSGVDTANSYIDQALPLDTAWIDDARQGNELAAMSPAWGIGAFDRIEISGFTAGNTYTLIDLSGIYMDPYSAGLTRTYFGKVTYVQEECDAERFAGVTVLSDDPAQDWRNYLWCHIRGFVNGRETFEVPSIHCAKSPNYAVDNYDNISIKEAFSGSTPKRYPADDFNAYTFNIPSDYTDCWDDVHEEYTDENTVLYSADTCPIWFCLTNRDDGEHDNLHDAVIKAAPKYDIVTVHPWYGDGTGVTARTGVVNTKLYKRVRARVNGIAWSGGKTPYDNNAKDLTAHLSVRETNSSGIEYYTDSIGYFREGDVKKPALLYIGTGYPIVTLTPIKNRQWYRVCFDGAVGGWLRYNPNTGELIYTVYPEPGSLAACNQP